MRKKTPEEILERIKKAQREPRPDFMTQEYLTYEEVAAYLGLDSISTVEKWVQADKIPYTRLSSKCVRFPRKLIDKWLAEKTVVPATKPLSLVRKERRFAL